jgi:flagellar biosynthesis/type III secretory pathway protein FliH
MNGTIPSTETEYRTATERVLAEGERRGERKGFRRGKAQGIAQGIEQGVAQGVAQARYSLIERVRTLLGDEAAASLEDIDDFDVLSARAFEMMAERR